MKKLFIIMFAMVLVSMSFVSAISSGETDLNPVEQGECVDLYQRCSDCTYTNLTSILFPNGTLGIYGISMTKNDVDYTYNFCTTTELGLYTYNVKGDPLGTVDTNSFTFEVTPSGNSGIANIVFFLFAIVLIYSITFVGFFGRNIPMTVLGGMALLFLGVYLIQNGIIIFQDTLTLYIGYLTIAVGIITSFWALLEYFDMLG